jgi:hypothetical protein
MDCAATIPFEHVVAMGDAILHRRLASLQELERFAQWGFRRRGVMNVRRALPMLDAGAESPGESLTRTMLILGGLPAPRCNPNIYERGTWLARVDMAWLAARVIVEYDGAVHLEEQQRRRDAERLNRLQAAGWRVIVLTADDLRRPEATCLLVRRALEQRSPR